MPAHGPAQFGTVLCIVVAQPLPSWHKFFSSGPGPTGAHAHVGLGGLAAGHGQADNLV